MTKGQPKPVPDESRKALRIEHFAALAAIIVIVVVIVVVL